MTSTLAGPRQGDPKRRGNRPVFGGTVRTLESTSTRGDETKRIRRGKHTRVSPALARARKILGSPRHLPPPLSSQIGGSVLYPTGERASVLSPRLTTKAQLQSHRFECLVRPWWSVTAIPSSYEDLAGHSLFARALLSDTPPRTSLLSPNFCGSTAPPPRLAEAWHASP